jgi:hypothetical protein
MLTAKDLTTKLRKTRSILDNGEKDLYRLTGGLTDCGHRGDGMACFGEVVNGYTSKISETAFVLPSTFCVVMVDEN